MVNYKELYEAEKEARVQAKHESQMYKKKYGNLLGTLNNYGEHDKALYTIVKKYIGHLNYRGDLDITTKQEKELAVKLVEDYHFAEKFNTRIIAAILECEGQFKL